MMSPHSRTAYHRAVTCARFERIATGDQSTLGPIQTSWDGNFAARVRQTRLDNAAELARAVLDFDIATRAGQPYPPGWHLTRRGAQAREGRIHHA